MHGGCSGTPGSDEQARCHEVVDGDGVVGGLERPQLGYWPSPHGDGDALAGSRLSNGGGHRGTEFAYTDALHCVRKCTHVHL